MDKKTASPAEKPAGEEPKPVTKPQEAPGLLKKEKEFVVPGDRIVESMEYLPGRNCFREGNSIYAKRIGIAVSAGRVVSVIALNSIYNPRADDMVIGQVTEIRDNGWVVEIGSPYGALLPLSQVNEYVDPARGDMARMYDIGDMLYCRVSQVSSAKRIDVSMLDRRTRKFHGGRILKVNPAKVPRIIGKMGSMISMIKEKTGCIITAGQNGLIWLMGEKPVQDLAIETIRTIEREAHKDGLTDRIEAMLNKAAPKRPAEKPEPAKEAPEKEEKK
jgi:exosome complex component RRP4